MIFKLKRTIKMKDFLYKIKVRKRILLRTIYSNLIHDVKLVIIVNKIKRRSLSFVIEKRMPFYTYYQCFEILLL